MANGCAQLGPLENREKNLFTRRDQKSQEKRSPPLKKARARVLPWISWSLKMGQRPLPAPVFRMVIKGRPAARL